MVICMFCVMLVMLVRLFVLIWCEGLVEGVGGGVLMWVMFIDGMKFMVGFDLVRFIDSVIVFLSIWFVVVC